MAAGSSGPTSPLYEKHKSEILHLKRSIGEMIGDYIKDRDGQQDEREEQLTTFEENLNARLQGLERREAEVSSREEALDQGEGEEETKPSTQWSKVKPGWREVCSTCKVNFCTRPGECEDHTDGHHNCYRCHRDYLVHGYKGCQWMKGEAGKGKGKASKKR